VFGTPVVAPRHEVKERRSVVGLCESDGAVVYNGSGHADITRVAGGAYNSNTTEQWNGCILGGIPIFNNGTDVPQMWFGTYALTLKLLPLSNWPATLRCAIMRNFGSYLVAFNITDSSVNYPHLVQWSNPAAAGTVPTSWAYANPTVEGGRKDLPDTNSGFILEAMQLGSTMFIYKERSVWKMNYIGGTYIYQFDTFLAEWGFLRLVVCVWTTGRNMCS
jgi:hypothetical protein